MEHRLSWGRSTSSGGKCEGSIAECMAENEFDMDSEINRRILATTDYISYGALQRNTVPCSRKGASYYNCKQGAEANPYNRDCSSITRCQPSSGFMSSAFGLDETTGEGEPSMPISVFKSLILCSKSFIRLPISSSSLQVKEDETSRF
ncbi:hypothetical protein G4B88_000232 [Cannabis sativa]|uniref:Uncharacterized protein n=1 Tax=Cannabis sativa TaxID=3483 RepID=A0A7J6GPH7_CANSA|nr:hypothetical protein G4B88_000232 [Cannabis sativa]